MRYRTQRLTVLAIFVLTAVASALAYPSLPETMATHWGTGGSVNDTMPRLWGAAFGPLMVVFIAGVLYLAPRIDPRRRNIEAFRDVYEWFVVGMAAFLAYVHGLVLAWNLGYEAPIGQALVPAIAVLYYAVGALMERARPNWFIGIRTPWTLEDEAVWESTHRRAALGFKLAGVLALGGLLLPSLAVYFLLVPVVLAAGYALVHSYLAYRRRHRNAG